MGLTTNLDELKNLSTKITGNESTATNIAEAIAEIAAAYSGGSGGAGIASAKLYPDSDNVIKDGSITLSNGAIIDIELEYIPEFSVTSSGGSTSGTTKLTVSNTLGEGNSYRYDVDRTPSKPAIGEDVSGFTSWDGTSDLTVDDGVMITLVECDANNKAVKVGVVTAVITQ